MKKSLNLFLLMLLSLSLFYCEDENNPNEDVKGDLRIEVTDAPIDDPDVEAVFVTVSEVKVDGEVYDGFYGKKTINIKALQNGQTEALGLGDLEAGTYNNISLVLDYESDDSGNSPGCYVLKSDQSKVNLNSSAETSEEVVVKNGAFEVMENATSEVVIDFDLRKAITYNGNNKDDYRFRSNTDLENSLRFVSKAESGMIEGNCDRNNNNYDKIVVYAYQEGSFNSNTETSGDLAFQNAVTSASVDANGDYRLSFLQQGDYELVFAGYNEDNNGKLSLAGRLDLNALLNINLGSISVGAESSTTVNVEVIGLLPF